MYYPDMIYISLNFKRKRGVFYIYTQIFLWHHWDIGVKRVNCYIMMSTNIRDTDPILNLKDLFYEKEIRNEINKKLQDFPRKNSIDNMNLLKEIQEILKKCTHLTPEQRLLYCQSQRYFMKLYLREVNR
jgi:hypothetical protein